jgi:hypothetical protein
MFSAYDLREKLRLARFRARERVACSLYKLYKLYKANNLCCETGVVVPPLFWDRRVQEFQNPTWRTGAVGSLGTPLGDLPDFSHNPYMLCFWFWDSPLEFPSVLQMLQLDEVYKSISTITRTQTPLHAHSPEPRSSLANVSPCRTLQTLDSSMDPLHWHLPIRWMASNGVTRHTLSFAIFVQALCTQLRY